MNKSDIKKEEMREVFSQGLNLGVILFAGAVAGVWASGLQMHRDFLFDQFIPVVLVCMVIGFGFEFLRSLPELGLVWFRGTAAANWLPVFFILFFLFCGLAPGSIRYMLVGDLVVLTIIWAGNYLYVNRIAKQLNHGKKAYTLMVDLKENPKTKEEFFEEIELYCKKNRIDLEYVEREIPAIVKLNGELYKVELNYYYTFGGPVYTLEFKTITK